MIRPRLRAGSLDDVVAPACGPSPVTLASDLTGHYVGLTRLIMDGGTGGDVCRNYAFPVGLNV